MKLRIALATSSEYPELTRDDQLLFPAFAKAGISGEAIDWRQESVNWADFDAVVLRNTWDYFEHLPEFLHWLTRLEKSRVRVLNPTNVLRENINKLYLRDLENKGIPTPPTHWFEAGEFVKLRAFMENFTAKEFVLKPAISAGGFRTHRCRREEIDKNLILAEEILSGSTLMVQPFLKEFTEAGELSFIFFGGEFSHSVVKRPKQGDFRVQWTHGGTHEAIQVAPEIAKQARAIVEKLPQGLLYARIDGIVSNGTFLLVEAELLEPYLFFKESAGSAERFTQALLARINS